MAKKQKRKRAKKTRKRPPTATPPGGIKISEAILRLCEPLRNQYQQPHRIQFIISMTVIAWNISLFPEEERPYMREMLLDALPKQLSGEEVAELLKNIEALIECKEKNYRHIREYILKHQVSFEGDSYSLTVGTAPVPEKIQRREP